MNKQNEKSALIKKYTPKSNHLKCGLCAFLFGGVVCSLGEALRHLLLYYGIDEDSSFTLVSVSMIILASILTGIGVFDRLARVGGAGLLLPITGFSNSITSEAQDAKSEGFIMGVGAKIFTVAGPVLLYGIVSGALYGIVYFIVTEVTKMRG